MYDTFLVFDIYIPKKEVISSSASKASITIPATQNKTKSWNLSGKTLKLAKIVFLAILWQKVYAQPFHNKGLREIVSFDARNGAQISPYLSISKFPRLI